MSDDYEFELLEKQLEMQRKYEWKTEPKLQAKQLRFNVLSEKGVLTPELLRLAFNLMEARWKRYVKGEL